MYIPCGKRRVERKQQTYTEHSAAHVYKNEKRAMKQDFRKRLKMFICSKD